MAIDFRTKIYFVSRNARWQKYRLEVLTKLGSETNSLIKILSVGKKAEYLTENENVQYILFRSVFPDKAKISFFPMALFHIIKYRPNIVLAFNDVLQLTEYFSLFLCKLLGVRFVWWTHAYDHEPLNHTALLNKLKKIYTIYFLKKGDAVITFSPKGTEYLIRHGIPSVKVFTAPNTLDTGKLIIKAEQKYKEIKLWKKYDDCGIPLEKRIILFSGRLNKQKRLEHALLAFESAAKDIPDICLVIIGNGPDYIPVKEKMERGKIRNVYFLGEKYDDDEVNYWFSRATIFLMPAYLGLAVVHAFCFGLPVITENADNHGPEIQFLENGYNGYIVDNNDIESLSQRLKELLQNKQKLEEFSNNAFKTAKNKANIDNMITAMATAMNLTKRVN